MLWLLYDSTLNYNPSSPILHCLFSCLLRLALLDAHLTRTKYCHSSEYLFSPFNGGRRLVYVRLREVDARVTRTDRRYRLRPANACCTIPRQPRQGVASLAPRRPILKISRQWRTAKDPPPSTIGTVQPISCALKTSCSLEISGWAGSATGCKGLSRMLGPMKQDLTS
jgi:hypothetical protein